MKKFAYALLIASMVVSSAVAKTNRGISSQLPNRTTDEVATLQFLTTVSVEVGQGQIIAEDDYLYAPLGTVGLRIFDISNPNTVSEVGNYNSPTSYVAVSGNTAVVGPENYGVNAISYDILDVTDKSDPVLAGSGTIGNSGGNDLFTGKFHMSGQTLFINYGWETVNVAAINVANPSFPIMMSETSIQRGYLNSYLSDSILYFSGNESGGTDAIVMVDISSPGNLATTGSVSEGGSSNVQYMAGNDSVLFVGGEGVTMFDVTTRPNYSTIGSFAPNINARAFEVAGDFLVVGKNNGLEVYYIGDAINGNVIQTGTFDSGAVHGIAVNGNIIYSQRDAEIDVLDATQAFQVPTFVNVSAGAVDMDRYPQIKLPLTVTNQFGDPVNGLALSNFTLQEDEASQTLTRIETEGNVYTVSYLSSNRTVDGSAHTIEAVVSGETNSDTVTVEYNSPVLDPVIDLAAGTTDLSAFPEVTIPARVRDVFNDPVSGLTSSNFTLSEDAANQSPLSVTEVTPGGLSTAMVMNYSSTMSDQELDDQIDGFINYIREFAPGDSGGVNKYGLINTSYNNSTGDTTSLIDAMNHFPNVEREGRGIYQGLFYSCFHFEDRDYDNRVMLVVADGPDSLSVKTKQEALDRVQSYGAMIYAVGLGPNADMGLMRELADSTDGKAFYAATSSELPGLLRSIGASLHSNYEISYTTSNTSQDGSSRSVSLEVSSDDLTDSDVTSYTAPLEPSRHLSLESVTSSEFPDIHCTVTVQDEYGSGVSGLTGAAFIVSEDETGQALTEVNEQGGGSYELVYTTSNNVRDETVRAVSVELDDNGLTDTATGSYTSPIPADVTLELTSIDSTAFPEIRATVSALNEYGTAIQELTTSNFTLTEDEVDQNLLEVNPVATETFYFQLLLNNCETMSDQQLADQRQGFVNFLDHMDDGDTARVLPFANGVSTGGSTDNVEDLVAVLNAGGFSQRNGRTIRYAIGNSYINLNNTTGKGVVVVVADGPDSTSTNLPLQSMIDQLQAHNFTVHAIGLGPNADMDLMNTLADSTGGRAYYAATSSELPSLMDQIGATVHSSAYELVYTTTNDERDATLRNVNIEVSHNDLTDSDTGSYTAPIPWEVHLNLIGISDSSFPEIVTTVQVTDEHNLNVEELTSSAFRVKENGVEQGSISIDDRGEGTYDVSYMAQNAIPDGSTNDVRVIVSYHGEQDSVDTSYDAPPPPGLTLGNAEAVIPTVANLPITVENFSNVSVMEFYIDFDPSKVSFENITSEDAAGIVFNANESRLIISWFSTTPLNLANGDTLMMLHFATDGFNASGVETSPVTWAEGSYLANFDAVLFPGVVYVDGSVTGLSIADINGSISYFTSEIALEGALVSLSGDTSLTTTTDENGAFSFVDLLPGAYTVTPALSDEGHTGVNTLDAYRIQQSLDEINFFTNGYQLFASDVDQSVVVNTLDAFKIQRRVVGMDESFDAGEWAFINGSYPMTTENWGDAELSRAIELAGIDSTDQNFYGVRIGDANNTWPNLFLETDFEEEITGSLTIADVVVGPGRTTTVQLEALGLGEIGALEWHLEFDPTVVSLQHFELPGIGGEVVTTTDSTISVSWFNVASAMNCDARILGNLTFQAVEEVNVESDLHLYGVVLGDDTGEELWTDVQDGSVTVANMSDLNYQGAELVTDWELRPSYPNPFNAYTTLSFDVKDASEVQIHVYNVLGDLVETLVQGNLPKGRYTKSVNANSWSSGTYFVVMKTQSFNKVQKIVLLK